MTSGVSNFSDWAIGNLAPTAAAVTISGRVFGAAGSLRNADVTVTDADGNSRTVSSDLSGRYRFENVEAGQNYVFTVFSKRRRFAAQVVTVVEEMEDLNFTAEP